MNSTNKKLPGANGFVLPSNQRAVHPPRLTPAGIQLKNATPPAVRKVAAPSQTVRRPVAPPPYRPQQTPRVLQKKNALAPVAPAAQTLTRPAAPPIYRPHPVPRVLQKKSLIGQTPPSGLPKQAQLRAGASKVFQPKVSRVLSRPPAAPPVFNRQPVPRVLQTKKIGGPQVNQPRIQTGVRSPNRSVSNGVVQPMIYVAIDSDGHVETQTDEKRPPGCCSGKQGDHTTPFTALQSEIVNAIEGVLASEAWDNLADTLNVYKRLPGWDESTKWVTDTIAPHVKGLLNSKGDVNALQNAVDQMLGLRNQIALTSYPKGGHGNAEGIWAGSLQHQERQFQLGHKPVLTKDEVLDFIWKAFEHARFNNLQSSDRQEAIIKQHAITMHDAYPQLIASVGITEKDIVNHYPKHDWIKYTPK